MRLQHADLLSHVKSDENGHLAGTASQVTRERERESRAVCVKEWQEM